MKIKKMTKDKIEYLEINYGLTKSFTKKTIPLFANTDFINTKH